MKSEVLKLLKEAKGAFLSGQELSEKTGVTRTSVWNWINQLKNEGYGIESVTRKGYRLVSSPDSLTEEELRPLLKTSFIGNKIIYLDTVDSTNEEIKREQGSNSEGLIVISEEQTSGKGRLGRVWNSTKGKGIYMSILLKPEIEPQEATQITQIVAAAIVEGLLEHSAKVKVKWPNDIILNHKKISGILTEMSGELMRIEYVSVGIGINVNHDKTDFPAEILEKASSLKIETGKEFSRKEIAASILNKFEFLYKDFLKSGNIEKSIKICKENSILLGKEIKIISKNQEKIRKAVDINDLGELVIEDKHGNREAIFSGEISIRGLNGYI